VDNEFLINLSSHHISLYSLTNAEFHGVWLIFNCTITHLSIKPSKHLIKEYIEDFYPPHLLENMNKIKEKVVKWI